MRMHADELWIDEEIARRLVVEQFPQWRDKPVRRVASDGTVNAIFRIGDDLAARFPLTPADPAEMSLELAGQAAAMQELAVSCSMPTPVHVARGVPGNGYPLPWSVQTWLPGVVATPDGLAHSALFAQDLVTLLSALRRVDTGGRRFAGAGRGGDLPDADHWMEVCFEESQGILPVDELRILWGRFRRLPRADPDGMTHGDLIPPNLLVEGERLAGVLDGGGFGPADPALDLVCAWHLLDADARDLLRRGLDVGPIQWWRGAAWAFHQAMGLVWYYRDSNPAMSSLGKSTLRRILSDSEVNSDHFPAW